MHDVGRTESTLAGLVYSMRLSWACIELNYERTVSYNNPSLYGNEGFSNDDG